MLTSLFFISLVTIASAAGVGGWGAACDDAPSNCSLQFQYCGFGPVGQWASGGQKKCYCMMNTGLPQDARCCYVIAGYTTSAMAEGNCTQWWQQCQTNGYVKGQCSTTDRQCYNAPDCQLSDEETQSAPLSMPVSSAVALTFAGFLVGLIVAYGVYKCNKVRSKRVIHHQLECSHRSADESQIGDSSPITGARGGPIVNSSSHSHLSVNLVPSNEQV
jgi:hypothetical protein